MGDINLVLLASRWVHLTAAIVAIGGAAFTRFVLIPCARRTLGDEERERLRGAVRARWVGFVYACILLLTASGFLNFWVLAIRTKVEPLPYHPIFAVKLIAAFGVFFLASALAGKAPGFAKMRGASARWMSVLLLLAAVVVLTSAMLNQVRAASKVRQTTKATPAVADGHPAEGMKILVG